jgi:hypothetical protein
MFGFKSRKNSLTSVDVVWCFANILGRHPRTPAEINQFLESCTDFRDLVQKLVATPEFAMLVERVVGVLTAEHRVVHVHANNHRPYSIVGGVPVPSVLELTLARAHDVRLEKTDEVFPTPLDTPCYRGRADFFLGPFRF